MLAIRSAREGIKHSLYCFCLGYAAFFFIFMVLSERDPTMPPVGKLIWSVLAGAFVMHLIPGRSCYIPRSEKRKVRGRGGHIDHIWPYWLGGSNTADKSEKNSEKGKSSKRWKAPEAVGLVLISFLQELVIAFPKRKRSGTWFQPSHLLLHDASCSPLNLIPAFRRSIPRPTLTKSRQ